MIKVFHGCWCTLNITHSSLNIALFLSFVLFRSLPGTAQQSDAATDPQQKASPSKIAPRQETVVVTGTFEPVQLSDIDRAVSQLPVRDNGLPLNAIVEYLRLEPSIDLRERAPGGVQADVSIRGSSPGQTLVLVNGLRVNDVQTPHHSMDLPLPMQSIDRIEVLRGAGSTLYGSDALGGAINIIATPPHTSEFRLGAAIGNFGTNVQTGSAALARKTFAEQISFSRSLSTGFIPDRDHRSVAVSSATNLKTQLGNSNVLLAYSDRPFGAAQFYGNYPSWERTKSWLAMLQQELGDNTQLDLVYRRHSDVFDLYRGRPWVYENNHVSDEWQGALRRQEHLSQNGTLSYGIEGFREGIDSSNLGVHARNRGAVYLNYDLRAWTRLSFSIGGREELYNSTRGEFSPSIAAGYWLGNGFKLRGSASHGFRIPTYTDLYYRDPANVGNPNLRPESAWSYEGGLQWDRGGRLAASATVFHRRDRGVIDYAQCAVSETSTLIPCDNKWHALNVDKLNFTGVETALRVRMPRSSVINLSYTGLSGSQTKLQAVMSRYAFSHLSHSGTVAWQGMLPGRLLAHTSIGVAQRYCSATTCAKGQTDASRGNPYAIWDTALSRPFGYVTARLAFSNLTSTRYEEIQNVLMPGRSVLFGLELVIPKK